MVDTKQNDCFVSLCCLHFFIFDQIENMCNYGTFHSTSSHSIVLYILFVIMRFWMRLDLYFTIHLFPVLIRLFIRLVFLTSWSWKFERFGIQSIFQNIVAYLFHETDFRIVYISMAYKTCMTYIMFEYDTTNASVQDCSISIANAWEIPHAYIMSWYKVRYSRLILDAFIWYALLCPSHLRAAYVYVNRL